MTKFSVYNRGGGTAIYFHLLSVFLIVLLLGCGSDGTPDESTNPSETATTDMASVVFSIKWRGASSRPDSEKTIAARAVSENCPDIGITNVTCQVYDETSAFLTSDTWPCADGHGTMLSIPAGPDRRFVCMGTNDNDEILYQGQTEAGFTIIPGEIADVGTVEAFPFVPSLTEPPSDASFETNVPSLSWTAVDNAEQYRVQVSLAEDFAATETDLTTTTTSITPPGLVHSGTYYWKISAIDIYDNQSSSEEIRSFTVTDLVQVVIANDDAAVASENTPVVINVLDNDSAGVTISAVTQGSSGSVTISPDGLSVTYTPAADASGQDTFTYTATDGASSAAATVTVDISGVNDPPVATADAYTDIQAFSADNELTVLENDSDPDTGDALTLSLVDTTSAEGGTISLHAAGDRLVYTPLAGFFGEDTFQYRVMDSNGASATGDVTLTVVAQMTTVSITSEGSPVADGSFSSTTSASGRFVAFESRARLVPNDNNGALDVYVYDRFTGNMERVSVTSNESEADGYSYNPSISSNGQVVAFSSSANLVDDDSNGFIDIYVRDRSGDGTTERVSVTSNEGQADRESSNPSISSNGQFVAFETLANLVNDDSNGFRDIYVRDRSGDGTTERVSVTSTGGEAYGDSYNASISSNGQIVAFGSLASLVDDDRNGFVDIYLRDRSGGGTTERVSVTSNGGEADGGSFFPSISSNGQVVAFESIANLVNDDNNRFRDIYVRDRSGGGTTERVSVPSNGGQANGPCRLSSTSADGRFVAFESNAANFVQNDTSGGDVFIHDRQNNQTARVSEAFGGGTVADGESGGPAVSADGRFVVFDSSAEDLVADDTNSASDIFAAPNPLFP